ncbi:MAG TPA: DUF6064 family protein [Lysobacter sp.]|nr:DUF6064 family protein [Lysobacter sp.]
MTLPFTTAEFFQVFAAYNQAVWPLQLLLTLVAVTLLGTALLAPPKAGRVVSLGLGLLWAWLGFAYHLAFFRDINPAAPLFAALSLFGAAAFVWQGVHRRALRFHAGMDGRRLLGVLVVAFALIGYPLIGAFVGHRYPSAPTFGVPCPTTMFTFGILLMARPPVPRVVLVATLLWALIGSVAAFSLGVTQDLALLATLLLGGWMLLGNRPPVRT